MLRLIFTLLLLLTTLSTAKQFNYSCALQKPLQDSTFPTISLSSLELQVSHRVTHQLVTRVFAIFLKEIFDYEPITLNNYLEHYPIEKLTEKQIEYAAVIELSRQNDAAMNLEVWVTPDPHVVFPGAVVQGGSLSNDLSRFGLFIREDSTIRDYSYNDFTSNNQRYHEIVNDFKINNEMEQLLLKNVEKTSRFDGVYRPRRCNSTTEPCIAVLTSFYDDMSFFIQHVERFELRMNIYFLGNRLHEVVRLLNLFSLRNVNKLKKNISPNFLVFHWTPSEIINGSMQYKPIQMPNCELYKNETNNCRYEIIPVSVYFNEEVKKSEDLIDITRRFHFPSLKPLIDLYEEFEQKIEKIYTQRKAKIEVTEDVNDYYNQIACKWLQENKQVYTIGHNESWFRNPDGQMEISIGGIFPNPGTGKEYDGIPAAIDMAVNLINGNPSLLSGYKLVVKRVNSDCKPDLILKRFINYYSHRKHLIGVLGPSCSEAVEPIAGISKHFKMSVITYSAEGISFDKREHYPFFFRTIGETTQHEDVYIKLFKQMNWKRLAAVTEDGMKYTEYITHMADKLPEFNMKLIENKKITRETNGDKRLENLKTSLKDLMDSNAKIIIADVHDHILLKSVMCAASKLDMTAKHGYVWFLPVYVSMKINDTLMQDINSLSCNEAELRNALDGHLSLSYASFGNDEAVIEGGQTIAEWKQVYLHRTGLNQTHFSDYAGFTYDAIWVYVKALQRLIQEDSPKHRYMRNLYSDQTMERLATLIHEMNFQGVSGQISFSRGGSRFTDINILQWQKQDFVLVGKYKPKISNRTITDGELTMNGNLTWLGGDTPKDGRESCSIQIIADLFKTSCNKINTLFAIILCIFAVIFCSAASFFFWKRRYDKKIVESEKMLGGIQSIINGVELAKWEIARENVVINRRLGEGAFGTVYGGEALIDEEDGWTAVAIKTLKAGSNAENRLDFLAESETMKRFDHKNIVKLLAVCLQAEPLYNIMEYMLYGDLKTYLLARRHLVNDKLNDDSDVSPKRLTLMALDIARGLSYLASMNYVHRDVACRNCMINAQRVVKIGDFGMARQTFESEYYRFVRKGMLPVRWMAPESVDGGIFSHASDMWSYGVTLFEIVTLCAFPFQGMNNAEVFEHVKQGNSIKIPATCKPHLRALLSSCFSVDPKKRPGASTIVEFISNNPRILTPCMDVPKPCLDYQVNLIDGDTDPVERFEQMMDLHRDRSHTPATIEFLRTSVSSSALQNHQVTHPEDPSSFEYLDMNLSRKPNGICLSEFRPDLTAMLPNGNYNPVEPLLQTRPEISKSNLSLMKYMPMCGFGNRSSPDECTSAL